MHWRFHPKWLGEGCQRSLLSWRQDAIRTFSEQLTGYGRRCPRPLDVRGGLTQRFHGHQGCREPSQTLASPSSTSTAPTDFPSARWTVLSFRPYLSSSRPSARNVKGPALSRSRNLAFAFSPSSRSNSHLGGLSSGVSMSAMRIFTPSRRKVSPSTTQVPAV